ncbi:hypothetical protein YC2023_079376 [Brassica napus]
MNLNKIKEDHEFLTRFHRFVRSLSDNQSCRIVQLSRRKSDPLNFSNRAGSLDTCPENAEQSRTICRLRRPVAKRERERELSRNNMHAKTASINAAASRCSNNQVA